MLEGRTALVTGGGRGIGEAIAWALAEVGARVIVAARTATEIEVVVAALGDAGHDARAIPCDVGDPDSVAALAAEANEAGDTIDVLVNNAGIATAAPLAAIELEEWEAMMRVNATGTFLCTRAFAPPMAERGWGRIVNIASVVARVGARYVAAYTASKHAALGFTRSVALELAPFGVTANALCPGYVDTPMTDATIERIVDETGRSVEEARQALLEASPQGRMITPAEVADAVVWLCSDAARGVNGQAIVIDGGGLVA